MYSKIQGYKFLITGFYIIVFFLTIYCILDIGYGLDTSWDEGFYLKWLDDPSKSMQLTQSFNFIDLVFGFAKSYLFEFRILGFIFRIIYIVIFIFIIKKGLRKEYINFKTTEYFILFSFFLPSFISYSNVLSYRDLQQFFILIPTSIYFLYYYEYSLKRFIYLFLISIFLVLAILNIPPSGVVFSFLLFSVLFFTSAKKNDLFYLIGFMCLNFLLINAVYIDLRSYILINIERTKIIMNSSSGHSVKDLILNTLVLIKLVGSKYLIIGFAFFLVHKLKLQIIKYLLFVVLILISNLWFAFAYDFLLVFLAMLLNEDNLKKISLPLFYQLLFLFLLPIAASFGSNTPTIINSYYYIPCWGIALFLLLKFQFQKLSIMIITFSFVLISSFYFINKEFSSVLGSYFHSREYYLDSPKIKRIGITKKQKRYFSRVNRLLKLYDYDEKKDLFFTFHTDLITVYIFNGKLSTVPYHELSIYCEDYISGNQFFTKPSFIFLDSKIISIFAKMNSWDFPKSYDKYFIGNPNENGAQRYMYCIKSKKIKDEEKMGSNLMN